MQELGGGDMPGIDTEIISRVRCEDHSTLFTPAYWLSQFWINGIFWINVNSNSEGT